MKGKLINLLTCPLYILSFLIKKRHDIWIFGSWFGMKYSDNTKYFFEHCYCQHYGENRYIWIYKSRAVKEKIINAGSIYECYYYLSLKGIYFQLIAGRVFVTQSVVSDLLPAAISENTIIYQLWHGLPLKKIMYDSLKPGAMKNFITKLFPYLRHRQNFLIVPHGRLGDIMRDAFRLTEHNVIRSGQPRVDVFYDVKHKSRSDLFNVIYMPTFRGEVNSEFKLFKDVGLINLNKALSDIGVSLDVRLHPVNKFSEQDIQLINVCSNINISTCDDIYEKIADYDLLITDFSSVYFDFLISGKPIIFAPFEIESYLMNDRELYFGYTDATLGPYLVSWPEIVDRIKVFSSLGSQLDEYYNSYNALFDNFLGEEKYNLNVRCSERLYRAIEQ